MPGAPLILFLVLAFIGACQAGRKRYAGYRSSYGKGGYGIASPYAYGKSAGYRAGYGYGKYGYRRQLGEVQDSETAEISASASDEGHRTLYGQSAAAIQVQSLAGAVPSVSYSKSYQPVQSTRAVTSLKPVVSYKPVTDYQTVTEYKPTLSKHHSIATAYVASGKGRRTLFGNSGAATVAVPTVSYSKTYRPVQSTRAVTSVKPVVSYKPVTEFETVTQYQPTLSKHHSSATAYVTSSKGRRVLSGKSGAVSAAVPTVSYSKSYRPVQSTHAVTSLKPVVSYQPVTEYQTTTEYQPTLEKHHHVSSVSKGGYRRQLGESEEGAADLDSLSAGHEETTHSAEEGPEDAESTADQDEEEQDDSEASDAESTESEHQENP